MRLYFHPDKTKGIKQGLVMEDRNHNAVCNSCMTKFSLFKGSTFEFTNHLTGATETHQIGATVEISKGMEEGEHSLRYIVDNYFKYDGEVIWEYFFRNGYTVDPFMDGLRAKYFVYRRGQKIAVIESAGTDLFNDNERETGGLRGKLGFRGYYRVDCEEEDIDIIYLICFSLERTLM